MAIDINIPSQVKTFANLAAFPASGADKTIYIAEDTNKTYRWAGSVYVEISASAAGATWGSITGTLSSQTDLQTALDTATFTIELIAQQTVNFYAPDDLRINTITNIVGSPTVTLKVNDVAYTLTDLINQGDKITVEVNIASVVNLNAKYE